MSKRKRHRPKEILTKLRKAEEVMANGGSIADAAKSLEVSEATLNRWRNQYGGMKGPDMKRLKELEKQNAQLKKLVADQALDIAVLKDISQGNFEI